MKITFYIILALTVVLSSCKKDEKINVSGIETINNTIYTTTTYYVLGFSFSQNKQISNLANPWPDITVDVNKDNIPYRLIFTNNNSLPSFYMEGEYPDESSAKTAFDNLKNIQVPSWQFFADPVLPNQVWVYRSQKDKYAKLRIISTKNEKRGTADYGECTFQWVYQPDGSITFQ